MAGREGQTGRALLTSPLTAFSSCLAQPGNFSFYLPTVSHQEEIEFPEAFHVTRLGISHGGALTLPSRREPDGLTPRRQLSQSRWLINNKHLFLAVLEAEEFQVKAQADLMSGEGYFLIHGQPAGRTSSLHTAEGEGGLSEVSFLRTRIPSLLKAPSPKAFPLGIRFQHLSLVGDTNTESTARINR